jgi:hypothetical protein
MDHQMSDSKQTQDKWRAEMMREQRKARLAGMKSKDGGKKPIRTSNKLAMLITVLVLAVILIGTGIWWVFNLGVPNRTVTALTVGNEKISAAEFGYFYNSQLSYYSIDPTTSDGQATLKSAYDETFPTIADFLKDQAAKEVQQLVILEKAAKAAGTVLDADGQATVESYMTNIKSYATQKGQSTENYLIAMYGKGMNEAIMRGILEMYVLTDKYSTQLKDSYNFSDADLQKYYTENKDDFDLITYRDFYIAADSASNATDAQKKEAMAKAKAKADQMSGKIISEVSFKVQCIFYAANDAEKTKYVNDDLSLNKDQLKSSISDDNQSKWLFDTARKAGDKTVIESSTGYYVLYFVNRKQNATPHVSVRHILIAAATDTATAAEIAAAKTKAEGILAQYKAGAKTEEAFTALVKANTEDTGSAETGGLYSDISPSSSYVEEFLDWAVDSTRKAGDTGIVQTKFGFHIMYFVGVDDVEWRINVRNTLISNKYSAFLEEQAKINAYSLNSFGMRFVG